MREDLPKDTLASIQARAAASATWLDATTFEGLLNSEATRGQTLAQLRQSGAVLGVWSPNGTPISIRRGSWILREHFCPALRKSSRFCEARTVLQQENRHLVGRRLSG